MVFEKRGNNTGSNFIVKYSNGEVKYIEFQYAKEELNAYDFKISKIAPKDRKLKKRVPKEDTKILYIIKPTYQYALLDPNWIVKNSTQTVAVAWGNTPVFRVARDKFEKILKKDNKLKSVCKLIDKKKLYTQFPTRSH